MIYLIVFSAVAGACGLIVFIFLAMQYRSLQAWRIDHNYNPSLKKGATLTAEEIVEMLQKSRPLPVDTLQGWTLYSFENGTRIWWHNFSISNTKVTVFASFGGVSVPTMAVFQVLKDISHTWSWKPGVMSTSYILRSTSKQKSDPRSSPSLSSSAHSSKSSNYDVIAEEHLNQVIDKSKSHRLPCQPQITDTVTVTLQRYWGCDSGGGWLLETNEKTGDWTVYIVQPIKASKQSDVTHSHSPHVRYHHSAPYTFQCLITVLVHEQFQSPVVTAALTSRLLGSLQNFFQYRKVAAPTFPYVLFQVDSQRVALQRSASLKKSITNPNQGDTRFLHHVRSFLEKRPGVDPKSSLSKEDRQKTEDILRPQMYTFIDGEVNADLSEADTPQSSTSSPPATMSTTTASTTSSVGAKPSKEEQNKVDKTTEEKEKSVSTDLDNSKIYEHPSSMFRSVSCYEANSNIPTNFAQSKDHQYVFYQTIANETAATLLKELTLSSNISLGISSDDLGNSLTGGWVFCGLDDEVVILRKLAEEGSTVQRFMGKGVIHVPPKVVWDTIRNPKTKFAYDESLKKVDVLEAFGDTLKVVYFYHEVVGLFRKDCCDACVILSERTENNRFILSMKSVNYDKTPSNENTTRATIHPSGWIIEPIVKDNKLCSMVTYIMQMDFGPAKSPTEKYPFEELVARQPLSIADLRRYLRSFAVWTRRHSTPARS